MKPIKTPMPSRQNINEPAEVIKLGLDIHADKYVVARQIDGSSPQSAQRFTPETFLVWAKKQTRLAKKVYCCYEAGCFGYWLHRRLEAIGVINFVVRPRNWDEYGQKVKTDKRDAAELLQNLDRFIAGNTRALQPVRVPTEEEERERSQSRQRDGLSKERKRLENQGTSAARYYGLSLPAEWWKPKKFEKLRQELPVFFVELIAPWQRLLLVINEELKAATVKLEQARPRELPVGFGALTATILDREICDWDRFNNRRQVGSYTGLCPRENSSGGRHQQGSITKHGNPKVRHVLLETVWRMFHFQPDYKPICHWRDRIRQGMPLTGARKKKMAVAIARELAVDWWRIQTGRIKPEDVGLKMALPQAPALRKWRKQQEASLAGEMNTN
jgi:transposase